MQWSKERSLQEAFIYLAIQKKFYEVYDYEGHKKTKMERN